MATGWRWSCLRRAGRGRRRCTCASAARWAPCTGTASACSPTAAQYDCLPTAAQYDCIRCSCCCCTFLCVAAVSWDLAFVLTQNIADVLVDPALIPHACSASSDRQQRPSVQALAHAQGESSGRTLNLHLHELLVGVVHVRASACAAQSQDSQAAGSAWLGRASSSTHSRLSGTCSSPLRVPERGRSSACARGIYRGAHRLC